MPKRKINSKDIKNNKNEIKEEKSEIAMKVILPISKTQNNGILKRTNPSTYSYHTNSNNFKNQNKRIDQSNKYQQLSKDNLSQTWQAGSSNKIIIPMKPNQKNEYTPDKIIKIQNFMSPILSPNNQSNRKNNGKSFTDLGYKINSSIQNNIINIDKESLTLNYSIQDTNLIESNFNSLQNQSSYYKKSSFEQLNIYDIKDFSILSIHQIRDAVSKMWIDLQVSNEEKSLFFKYYTSNMQFTILDLKDFADYANLLSKRRNHALNILELISDREKQMENIKLILDSFIENGLQMQDLKKIIFSFIDISFKIKLAIQHWIKLQLRFSPFLWRKMDYLIKLQTDLQIIFKHEVLIPLLSVFNNDPKYISSLEEINYDLLKQEIESVQLGINESSLNSSNDNNNVVRVKKISDLLIEYNKYKENIESEATKIEYKESIIYKANESKLHKPIDPFQKERFISKLQSCLRTTIASYELFQQFKNIISTQNAIRRLICIYETSVSTKLYRESQNFYATQIQKVFRGYLERKSIEKMIVEYEYALNILQPLARIFLAKIYLNKLRQESEKALEEYMKKELAAIVIQRNFRIYLLIKTLNKRIDEKRLNAINNLQKDAAIKIQKNFKSFAARKLLEKLKYIEEGKLIHFVQHQIQSFKIHLEFINQKNKINQIQNLIRQTKEYSIYLQLLNKQKLELNLSNSISFNNKNNKYNDYNESKESNGNIKVNIENKAPEVLNLIVEESKGLEKSNTETSKVFVPESSNLLTIQCAIRVFISNKVFQLRVNQFKEEWNERLIAEWYMFPSHLEILIRTQKQLKSIIRQNN